MAYRQWRSWLRAQASVQLKRAIERAVTAFLTDRHLPVPPEAMVMDDDGYEHGERGGGGFDLVPEASEVGMSQR